ncbi:hypothetical protein [Hymenobacter cellulosilyticus]|uniref:Uncharacterized protein n=1 Tax=Hymenobacter cellulosilyticus TaxID=2932248 RepID=A0A8T9Q8R3_9BACT|nr:hypothetical protein [Hymenobacter cellulosilyticus]UOQ71919.1 hypothetical protein MUN79_25540 [Hymenobacter cellulosilyticus]
MSHSSATAPVSATAAVVPEPRTATLPGRLLSLDVFRGLPSWPCCW